MEIDAGQFVDGWGHKLWLLDLPLNYEEGHFFPLHALGIEAWAE